jgi:hypothetical protein
MPSRAHRRVGQSQKTMVAPWREHLARRARSSLWHPVSRSAVACALWGTSHRRDGPDVRRAAVGAPPGMSQPMGNAGPERPDHNQATASPGRGRRHDRPPHCLLRHAGDVSPQAPGQRAGAPVLWVEGPWTIAATAMEGTGSAARLPELPPALDIDPGLRAPRRRTWKSRGRTTPPARALPLLMATRVACHGPSRVVPCLTS